MTKALIAAVPTNHLQGVDLLDRLYTMKPAELRARWREVYRSVAPNIGPDLLRRGIAYRLQERGQGSLTSSTRREIERQIKRLGKDDGASVSSPSLKPGTRLVRSWRGKMHQVQVLEDGFEFDGRRYGSLTQIASDVTGTHWSGPRFFGLLTKSRGRAATS
ncbi:DUF2924 domain-containing protein [Sphingorhabdus contaminans]|uniref:DUF2924 domain-containing protein n=1 Tax=Sphingorhabdus contaminans TaxID=1343899 RepID=UPI003D2E8412